MTTTATLTTTRPSRKAARIREAQFADYPGIAALEDRFSLNPKNRDQWESLWKSNPAFIRNPGWQIGWVVESHSHEIVGHIANLPTLFHFRGKNLLAASGRGLVVAEAYRSYAFALFGKFFNQPTAELIVNSTVNSQGLNLHELFRARRVPSGAWDSAIFWITSYRAFASRLAKMKALPAAEALSYPLATMLASRDALKGSHTDRFPEGITADWCQGFDDRFEKFWRQLQSNFPDRLLASRSLETLEWHFGAKLRQGEAWLIAITKSGKLVAYACFLRQDNSSAALTRMRLVDYQSVDDNADLLKPVIAMALARCRKEKIHMLEAIGFSPEKRTALEQVAHHKRDLPCWLYFYSAKSNDLAAQLENPAVWDPSPYDGDGSL